MGLKRKGLYTFYASSAAQAAMMAQEVAGINNMRRIEDKSGTYWFGRLASGVYVAGRESDNAGFHCGQWNFQPEWKPTPAQIAAFKGGK
jgi:hypothetical protein